MVLDELADTCDLRRDDGPRAGESFDDRDRQAFGKARNDEKPAAIQFLEDFKLAQPPAQPDLSNKPAAADIHFEKLSQRTVADQFDLRPLAFRGEHCKGIEQLAETFPPLESGNAGNGTRLRDRNRRGKKPATDSHPDHAQIDFSWRSRLPRGACGPFADRNGPVRSEDQCSQSAPVFRLEVLRPVDRHGPGWSAKNSREPGNDGGTLGEVNMQMGGPGLLEAHRQPAGQGKVAEPGR